MLCLIGIGIRTKGLIPKKYQEAANLKSGGNAIFVDMCGEIKFAIEVMDKAVPFALERKNQNNNYYTTTWHYSTSDFATFSATKNLINEIMSRKVSAKSPFRKIFRA